MYMNCLNCTYQGEDHKLYKNKNLRNLVVPKESGKECQDYSLVWQNKEKNITIAIVSDGHGGDSYFRSAIGSRLASEITLEKVLEFLSCMDRNMFIGMPFKACGTQETIAEDCELNKVMRKLFESIYASWRLKIAEDGKRELTDWEKDNVEQKYIDLLQDEDRIVKAYGCTLLAYVCTNDFWFSFHIGDGKIVMLDSEYKFSQPVPWDKKCFSNVTTSLCDPNPTNLFRFCIQGDGKFPVAMFLGSDGIDDTYKDGDKLYSFYGNFVKELGLNGHNALNEMLKAELPQTSKKGSHDDVSVAMVYDDDRIKDGVIPINEYQKSILKNDIINFQEEINNKRNIISEGRKIEETYSKPLSEKQNEINTLLDLIDRKRNEFQEIKGKYETGIRDLEDKLANKRKEYFEIEQKQKSTNTNKTMVEARMAEKEVARIEQNVERLQHRLKELEAFSFGNINLN